MILDARTIMLSYALSNALCLAVMFSMWRIGRRSSGAYAYWLADFAMQFVAILLLMLRGTALVPDPVSVSLAVPLAMGGTLLLLRGVQEYLGRAWQATGNYLLLAALIAAHFYFYLADPSLKARQINLSLGIVAFGSQIAWLTLRQVEPAQRRVSRYVGWIMAAYVVASLVRIATDLLHDPGSDFFSSGNYSVFVLLCYQILFIGLTFSLVLMVNRRLFGDLHRLNAGLEDRVRARTADLEANNAALAAARDAAEAANRAKSAFLSNMSHEIRTPLHVISGMTHLVRRDGVTVKQGERLDRVDQAGKHLLDIINDVLDLSKIEAGSLVLDDTPVALGPLIEDVRTAIAAKADAQGLEVVVDMPRLDCGLRGDGARLRQALLNYAANAVKFTEKGRVTLRAEVAEEGADSLLVRFEVLDTGIGIAADALPRLFKAFEQADNSNARQYGGTGLGLAIARRLAELMGGSAGATSSPGGGSCFWFTARLRKDAELPLIAADEVPQEVLKRDYGHLRVLVADDDADNRFITRSLLNAVWSAIDLAEDGMHAVDLAGRKAYDIVLMDMRMPRMDGLEAARRLRALPGGDAALILALTANVYPENKAECIAAGMDGLIPKATGAEAPFGAILEGLRRRAR